MNLYRVTNEKDEGGYSAHIDQMGAIDNMKDRLPDFCADKCSVVYEGVVTFPGHYRERANELQEEVLRQDTEIEELKATIAEKNVQINELKAKVSSLTAIMKKEQTEPSTGYTATPEQLKSLKDAINVLRGINEHTDAKNLSDILEAIKK